MDKEIQIPFFARIVLIIIGLFVFFTILYIGQSIIVPLVFATIISIVLHPAINWLIRMKINRMFAIVIVFFVAFLVIAAFGLLLIKQVQRVSESWPALADKFNAVINQNITDAAVRYDIDPQKIHDWITTAKQDLIDRGRAAIGQTLAIIGNALVILFLIPVYVFMILYYHPLIHDFIFKLFSETSQSRVRTMVSQTKVVIQRYLVGLVFEFVIVATLNTVALLILGVEYAILLGIIGALLNIIPYIGGVISVVIYMLIALVTKSPEYMIYVFIAYTVIQFVDNNYIVPKIVASKVKINALASIIVVIAGNALWGIPGMFLSIPLLAIVKLILDNNELSKPWGFLLGDTMPPIIKIPPILKKLNLK
ncbi:MAG TPA: AI-2E family transporter [Draconibacterium sp.]|nr:AI-2E family transporter [Draconibacterium sp.]